MILDPPLSKDLNLDNLDKIKDSFKFGVFSLLVAVPLLDVGRFTRWVLNLSALGSPSV